jgi:hypothetical protein
VGYFGHDGERSPIGAVLVNIACAECGCVVDTGVIVAPCPHHPDCCCTELPVQLPDDHSSAR